MRTRAELALALLENARLILTGNLKARTLEESPAPAAGYRTVLGTSESPTGL